MCTRAYVFVIILLSGRTRVFLSKLYSRRGTVRIAGTSNIRSSAVIAKLRKRALSANVRSYRRVLGKSYVPNKNIDKKHILSPVRKTRKNANEFRVWTIPANLLVSSCRALDSICSKDRYGRRQTLRTSQRTYRKFQYKNSNKFNKIRSLLKVCVLFPDHLVSNVFFFVFLLKREAYTMRTAHA